MNTFDQFSIIKTLPGSLPMGGFIADTPIYRTHHTDSELLTEKNTASLSPFYEAIELKNRLAFLIHEVLTPQECQKLIHITEAMGYRPEAPGIQTPPGMRMNQSLHWLCEAPILETIFTRIEALLPQTLEGRSLYPKLSQRINFYRYENGNKFNRHTDGAWPGYGFDCANKEMVSWQGVESMLTMLLYLNDTHDNFSGGETTLYSDHSQATIQPITGSALFFRHGFGLNSVAHEGREVIGSGKKYVARINVMYTL